MAGQYVPLRANRYELMEMFLFGLAILTETLQHFFVYCGNFDCPHAGVYRVHYLNLFLGGGAGVSEFVMSLA
jgi:hypothetical protein